MPMATDQHQSFFKALNLGSFPRNVSSFQDSGIYLDQIIFVDHELQSTLQLVSADKLFLIENSENQERITQLINYVHSLNSTYSNTPKSYLEVYYGSVVLAHLQTLIEDYESAIATLNGFRIDHTVPFNTQAEQEFLDYICARFHSILGKASLNGPAVWSIFLKSLKRYGHANQVSANIWINSILGNLISELSVDGRRPVEFNNLQSQEFAKNICSLVSLANYALRHENAIFVSPSFKKDYLKFITGLINDKIKQRKDFPDSNDKSSDELDFVQSFYQTLNDTSTTRSFVTNFIKPKVSKAFLINMSEKTYQSQSVLLNLILSLIDLGEYDEAFAAFKTYISYVEKEKVQTGNEPDFFEVISLYSLCILLFNPLNSFIPDAKSPSKKFRYTSIDLVVPELLKFAKDLQIYLEQVAESAHLTYDIGTQEKAQDQLSFLYYRFNPQIFLDANSNLVRTVSNAWFALGNLHQYLCIHSSANSENLKDNIIKTNLFYKNSLIINSSGNLEHLFNYALALAYEHHISDSLKLCKFILKKYPESFKTWNLLALLTSATENKDFIKSQDVSDAQLKSHQNDNLDVGSQNGKSTKVNQSERFIDDALNIAGIFTSKQQERNIPLSLETKYEILQLKMTQLAIWEAKHGVESILEFITDIFVLYRELFLHVQFPKSKTQTNTGGKSSAKWSNRPSVMDAPETEVNAKRSSGPKYLGKDNIRRLSKISLDSTDGKHHKIHREEKETKEEHKFELRILQEIWLWTASIYLKLGYLEEAEQCIVEAETADKPNVKTHTYLGFLTSKTRKQLALQEYERSFEMFHSTEEEFNKKSYGLTLVGMSQLLVAKDASNESPFVSAKDRSAGLVRLKNYLEAYSNCWPYGHNSPELWYYLSEIYEEFDDRVLQSEALWKCVDLETGRPVRAYDICEDFTL